ncbi:MAG: hypothetical protein J6I40_07615 [Mailhella sp.]|nr:hypothetical protein [Mailhella sp.]
MEKLELLAQRIDSLIQELGRLRGDNARLNGEVKNLSEEVELGKMEAEELQKQISAGDAARNEACSRVDALIERIQAALASSETAQDSAPEDQKF